jgi:uncharacterized Zn finger protein
MSSGEWPTLTEATVRELARSKSYERGQSYYEQEAVSDVVRRGKTVRADVEGSQYQPYTVTIEFDDAGVTRTDCSCPYDHGGICKHRVAVLLTCIREPESVRDRPPISELVADADRETLQNLLVELADNRPEIADRIETRLTGAGDTVADPSVSVNIESIRRQANHALPKPGQRGHNDAYAEAERMAEELAELIEQVRMAIEAGDGETALDVLAAITDELANGRWADLLPYDVPPVFEVIDDLNQTFVEAILTTELTASERDDWEERLIEWDGGQFEYSMDESTFLAAADAAARAGTTNESSRRWRVNSMRENSGRTTMSGTATTSSRPGWQSSNVRIVSSGPVSGVPLHDGRLARPGAPDRAGDDVRGVGRDGSDSSLADACRRDGLLAVSPRSSGRRPGARFGSAAARRVRTASSRDRTRETFLPSSRLRSPRRGRRCRRSRARRSR